MKKLKSNPILLASACALSFVFFGCRVEVSKASGAPTTEARAESLVQAVQVPGPSPGVIDLAICLDTSGSMNGLIDSARQTLWSVVNDLALIQPVPELRVALVSFGNDGYSAEDGWVRIDAEFTTNLDAISEKLFALTTGGGTEFVGRVVHLATRNLQWSTQPKALKILVVAGNESADQDTLIGFREACKAAISADILVNSIYCGDPDDGLAGAWREVAQLADGHFGSIDKDNGMIVIETPFDGELQALTASVNTTYVAWGQDGAGWQAEQKAQDLLSSQMNNEAMASRAQAKNSALYVCSWDLVDATRTGQVKLADVDRKHLAEDLQELSDEKLAAYIEAKAAERQAIQDKITAVTAQRAQWLVEERARTNADDSQALDRVMRDAIRAQAQAKGLRFH